MKKVIGMGIAAVICAGIICCAFYLTAQRSKEQAKKAETLTEVQKLITKNLDTKYPETPREVIKLYNRIITAYYAEEYTEEEFQKLAVQAQKLMDRELLAKNNNDVYISNLSAEIKEYKQKQKKITQSSVCDSNSVKYMKDGDDEIAYVTSSYFVKEGNSYERTYQEYVLRQDANKDWKILVYYQIEGKSEEDD